MANLEEFMQFFTKMNLDRAGSVGLFLVEKCDMDIKASISSSKLYKAYEQWSNNMELPILTHKSFSTNLIKFGVISERRSGGRHWLGLMLKDD